VDAGAVCLLGPGDSGKTTILDAIHLVLGAHWTTTVHDHDFYDRDVAHAIIIEATVTGVPEALLDESRYGLELRGWTASGLRDEPQDDDELALTVRFRVDETLEPTWAVVNDRNPEGRPIGWRDRQRLGAARVGVSVERDLRWARGSALSRLTGTTDEVDKALTGAYRQARAAVAEARLTDLDRPLAIARRGAVALAAGLVGDDLHAALDTRTGEARLALHSKDIPLASFGQGTRRLTALGLQLADAAGATMLAVDELEHALEPWRARHLVRALKAKVAAADHPLRQMLCTTHSSAVVEQFAAEELHVVRRDASTGAVTVTAVPATLQALVRSAAEAFLARRVIVCEGDTELGICVELDDPAAGPSATPMSHVGTALAKGGGSACAQRAMDFRTLGLDVAVVADSDRDLSPDVTTLGAAGVQVIQWAGTTAIEERVFYDLPVPGLSLLFAGLVDLHGDHILDPLAASLAVDRSAAPENPTAWIDDLGVEESALRAAALDAAKAKWLKSIQAGRVVGKAICACWDALGGTELRTKLEAVLQWATA
jgi:putative ATP-dependent endonuclease of OLD family